MSRTELNAYETRCLQLLRQVTSNQMSFYGVMTNLKLDMTETMDIIASLRQKGLVSTKSINNIQHVRLV